MLAAAPNRRCVCSSLCSASCPSSLLVACTLSHLYGGPSPDRVAGQPIGAMAATTCFPVFCTWSHVPSLVRRAAYSLQRAQLASMHPFFRGPLFACSLLFANLSCLCCLVRARGSCIVPFCTFVQILWSHCSCEKCVRLSSHS